MIEIQKERHAINIQQTAEEMRNVVDYIFHQSVDDILDQKEFKHGIDLTHEEKVLFILKKHQKQIKYRAKHK